MSKIALWISVGLDVCAVERAIIARNGQVPGPICTNGMKHTGEYFSSRFNFKISAVYF